MDNLPRLARPSAVTTYLRHHRGRCPVHCFVSPRPRRLPVDLEGVPALLAFRISPPLALEDLAHASLELRDGISSRLRVIDVSVVDSADGPQCEVVAAVLEQTP